MSDVTDRELEELDMAECLRLNTPGRHRPDRVLGPVRPQFVRIMPSRITGRRVRRAG
jgi:hypothetical protein